jgi:CRP-like cAMP-binding protein
VPRTATAAARTRVEALRISRDVFVNVIRSNPDAAIALVKILADRLAKTTAQLRRMAAESSR